jgi:hypothetical protein
MGTVLNANLRCASTISLPRLGPTGQISSDVSPFLTLRFFECFNWDSSLRGCRIFEAAEVPQLEAADFVCHAIDRTWKGAEAKSHDRLAEGSCHRNKQFPVQVGTVGRLRKTFSGNYFLGNYCSYIRPQNQQRLVSSARSHRVRRELRQHSSARLVAPLEARKLEF